MGNARHIVQLEKVFVELVKKFLKNPTVLFFIIMPIIALLEITVPLKESFAREAQKWVVVEPLWMMGGWMFLIGLGEGRRHSLFHLLCPNTSNVHLHL